MTSSSTTATATARGDDKFARASVVVLVLEDFVVSSLALAEAAGFESDVFAAVVLSLLVAVVSVAFCPEEGRRLSGSGAVEDDDSTILFSAVVLSAAALERSSHDGARVKSKGRRASSFTTGGGGVGSGGGGTNVLSATGTPEGRLPSSLRMLLWLAGVGFWN